MEKYHSYQDFIHEKSIPCCKSDVRGDYKYFRYRLDRPILCTLNFRDFVTGGDPRAKIVPIKCGDGRKFTQTGVFTASTSWSLAGKGTYKHLKILYEPATKEDLQSAQKSAKIKIYYKGFPLSADYSDIYDFFEWYGPLEYLYMMGLPKNGKPLRSVQGYLIFTNNTDANRLLQNPDWLNYQGHQIFCEIFKPNKKKGKGANLKEDDSQRLVYQRNAQKLSLNTWPFSQRKDESMGNSPSWNIDSRDKLGRQAKDSCSSHVQDNDLKSQEVFKEGMKRPYLQSLDKVKSNSKDNLNIRFNICVSLTRYIVTAGSGQPQNL